MEEEMKEIAKGKLKETNGEFESEFSEGGVKCKLVVKETQNGMEYTIFGNSEKCTDAFKEKLKED